jgi:agmatinase
MTKEEKIHAFNPSAAGAKDSDLFGLPFTTGESEIVVVPVPWEVTVSYGSGTADGPTHILESSFQVDLYHPEYPDLWKAGIAMDELPENLLMRSSGLRSIASELIGRIEDGVDISSDPDSSSKLQSINEACSGMNEHVYARTRHWLGQGKMVGLLGGDHSTPLGFYRAQSERHDSFGILHIDAHMDLREAFEGFIWSHASVMHNALKIPQVSHIIQVGIRDCCEEEINLVKDSEGRVKVFSERENRRAIFNGTNWHRICQNIIQALPEKVHISFDIDGLDPTLCPDTGTPVPGGLSFEEAAYLLSLVAEERTLIGFDLVEVAPGTSDWNGNVGARMLFHLCGALGRSFGRC